jgi:signal transduction histidine kinase
MKYSPDSLFILDREEQVVSTNDNGKQLLDALNGRVGSPLSRSVPAFDPESLSNELIELEPHAGETVYYRVFVETLTRGGKRVGWVVVFRDETEQQRQQYRLQQQNEQMEIFASTISHDLRNPLSVAEGYRELAQDKFESEELDKIAEAHTRMGEIIEDVLTLARAGNQIEDLEAIPMEGVVERAWENVSTPTAELSVTGNRILMADPTMIQQAFENLFRNAVEHGGDDLQVTVGNLDDGMYVEDDGAGIPTDKRADVFEVGYTGTTDGTGLGLSIVKQIVTAHGWEIHVTDGTDEGARFEITGVEGAE